MQQSAQRGRAATKNENYLTTKNAKNTKKFSPPATGRMKEGQNLRRPRKFSTIVVRVTHLSSDRPLRLYAGELPVGLQIVARPFEEATAFRIAYAYEQATEWHERRPGL
jgi:Asp-tRNA(Asn)/Glu-tRNA(Gln) amidotransferase A subunit family amidase